MPIDSHIRQHIKEHGHIKLDDVMRYALSSSSESYYKRINEIGENGDFITSPEISQLFGEMIALWAIEKWHDIGKPKEFCLAELGPGRGKLMQDFLRVASLEKDFLKACGVYLYEINPNFIEIQRSNLAQYEKQINWFSDINDLPALPLITITNEFFDALPIKQYLKSKNKWFEKTMIVDPLDGEIKYHKIGIKNLLQEQFLSDHPNAEDGAILEESVESLAFMRSLSKHIKQHGGAGLFIDYGYYIDPHKRTRSQYNSTLQAVKDHEYSSIIATLGEADLTAHVDFYALAQAASERFISAITFYTQRDFLLKYGINIRLNSLRKSLSQADFSIMEKQVDRLINIEQMGELFKVLEIT